MSELLSFPRSWGRAGLRVVSSPDGGHVVVFAERNGVRTDIALRLAEIDEWIAGLHEARRIVNREVAPLTSTEERANAARFVAEDGAAFAARHPGGRR